MHDVAANCVLKMP